MTHGKRANRRGLSLERQVEDFLSEEYLRVPANKFDKARTHGDPVFSKQFPTGKSIYGKVRRVDFIVWHPSLWPERLVVQCKWQASGGSADEKYPFEFMCIEKDAIPAIIVLDGGGYHEGAEKWLRSCVGSGSLMGVMSFGELCRFRSAGKI